MDDLSENTRAPAPDLAPLSEALLALRDEREADRFLRDLLTPGEIRTLVERWRVARLLDEGGHSYREIAEMTGASTTTVTRVARFLSQEPWQGYRTILDRLKEPKS
ncbi:YerC/YecD family TrpR-related protein [Maricaulis sp.]|uniref:YerC/YecD family TrpR-related protein n=1 Tax=Maricaulis sp. TaxID=1486257 RepID=UPI001B120AD7|nr:YerC/YecD family TrpR-related protein [Maricaulis sp.]MBO6765946.1 helix-turn-helix domain-containing protein [Maricaulis sp.]